LPQVLWVSLRANNNIYTHLGNRATANAAITRATSGLARMLHEPWRLTGRNTAGWGSTGLFGADVWRTARHRRGKPDA
jgi:hypothetical protein